jgi:hypothetical protein
MSHPDSPPTVYPAAPPLVELAPLRRRARADIATAIADLSIDQARFLVDTYYEIQRHRLATANQRRALTAAGEPVEALAWVYTAMETVEDDIRRMLDAWTDRQPMGRWAKSVVGIGPVLSAGLLAHIDIERAPTVGHIWRFAGIDPSIVWGKGERRPYNARLKVICYLIGDSFVKFSNHPKCVYGHWYRRRKEREQAEDERGDNAETAAAKLASGKYRAETGAKARLSEGRLPIGQIDLRARRATVKLFLSHWHDAAYRERYGTAPAHPYPMAILGHADYISPDIGTKQASEPRLTSAPKKSSEPTGESAPPNASEPRWRRAPDEPSEPRQPSAPRFRSEP